MSFRTTVPRAAFLVSLLVMACSTPRSDPLPDGGTGDGGNGGGGKGGQGGPSGSGGGQSGGAGQTSPGGGATGQGCEAGFHSCNGVCVDIKDPQTCGAGCVACPTSADGASTCDGERCKLACNTGFHECDAKCVSDMSPTTCGKMSCAACPTPAGGEATCDGTQCKFNCLGNTEPCAGSCIAKGTVCDGKCAAGTLMCKGVCVPMASVPREDCLNGEDDDCDGMPDCADPDCAPVALCVPSPGDFRLVARLTSKSDACPTSFQNKLELGTVDAGSRDCDTSSCKCTGKMTCSKPKLYAYTCTNPPDEPVDQREPRCEEQCRQSIDEVEITVPAGSSGCTLTEAAKPSTTYFDESGGIRVGPTTGTPSCQASGSAKPPAVVMARQAAFCEAQKTSAGGCAAGQVCAPRPTVPLCVLAAGSKACPTGYSGKDDKWFTGYTGQRTCGGCSCGSPQGGSCSAIVEVGYDGCSALMQLAAGSKSCKYIYHPNALFGTPTSTAPGCSSGKSTVDKDVVQTGQQTICCL